MPKRRGKARLQRDSRPELSSSAAGDLPPLQAPVRPLSFGREKPPAKLAPRRKNTKPKNEGRKRKGSIRV